MMKFDCGQGVAGGKLFVEGGGVEGVNGGELAEGVGLFAGEFCVRYEIVGNYLIYLTIHSIMHPNIFIMRLGINSDYRLFFFSFAGNACPDFAEFGKSFPNLTPDQIILNSRKATIRDA